MAGERPPPHGAFLHPPLALPFHFLARQRHARREVVHERRWERALHDDVALRLIARKERRHFFAFSTTGGAAQGAARGKTRCAKLNLSQT